jgi:hypothetical protein
MLWVLRFAASLRNKGEHYCDMNGMRRQAQIHVLQPVSIVASAAPRVLFVWVAYCTTSSST